MSNSDEESYFEYVIPIKENKIEALMNSLSESEQEAWFQQAVRIINDHEIVIKYWERCRDFFYISIVSNLSLEGCISISPVTTPELVRKHPECEWNWTALSANPNITIDFVLEFRKRPWSWHLISINPNISWKEVSDHPELPWWPDVTKNPNIEIAHIFENPDKKWNWEHVCLKMVRDWKQVTDHIELPWNWIALAQNSNIEKRKLVDHLLENQERIPSWGDIREHFEGYLWDFLVTIATHSIFDEQMLYFFLDWPSICRDSSFTIPRINWCRRIAMLSWQDLSKNPNMTAEFVTENIQKEWDWEALSKQKFLTPEFVATHIDKWNFHYLMKNESLPKEYRESVLKSHWVTWKSKQPVVTRIVCNDNPKNLDIRSWNPDLRLEDVVDAPNVIWELGDILTQGFPIPRYFIDDWP
jgi:hypothetical protein